MVDDDKTIEVSEEIYKELEHRKHPNEPFDDVVRRVLGLVPQDVQQITEPLPKELEVATRSIVDEYAEVGDYHAELETDDAKQVLNVRSRDDDDVIYKVFVYRPNPPERINHRVEFRYRTPGGEMRRAAQYRDHEENALNVTYLDSETLEERETTRRGDERATKTAKLVGGELSRLVDSREDQS